MKGTSFLIELGNSNDTPLGACIRVTVPASFTPEQAVQEGCKFLESRLAASNGIDLGTGEVTGNAERVGVEYVRVFINSANIKAAMVADGDTEEIDKIT